MTFQKHLRKCSRVGFFHCFVVRQVFVNKIDFFVDKVKHRIEQKNWFGQLHKQFVPAVFLFYVDHLVLQNLLTNRRINLYWFFPEQVSEEWKWRIIKIGLIKFDSLDDLIRQIKRDIEQIRKDFIE